MANPAQRNDPLPVFCFSIEMKGVSAFFKSVTGLKYETESIPVREGGANDTTFMLVGATKWSPLVLKNGFTSASQLLTWREAWMNGRSGPRITGTITQLNTALEPCAQWEFTRGWPTKWEMAEFDASKSELAIETLEITHEGLKYKKLK
jgi:phage tail-like protein